MTLRRRMLAYLSLAAIASCVLTVGVAAVLVRHQIAGQRMSTLETQANGAAAAADASGALPPGEHVYAVARGRLRGVGPARTADVLAAIPPTGDAQGTVSVKGHALLYAARSTGTGRVVLIRPATLAFAEWRPFLGSLVLAGLGGTLLAVLLSYLLARRLTRPIAELSGATRRLSAGEPGVAVPIHGRDELSDLGQAFNAMSSELDRAHASQRRFLESVSHELKTPLTSILGYAEALEEGAVAPSEAARVIASEANQLERLVLDLLDLARLRRAGFSVAREPVNLTAVADEAVKRHLPRARELSVALSSSNASDAWALGDEGRVLQATSNLIENALRLTPAGGSVIVEATNGQVAVRDTGPGLAPADIPRAFERFYLHGRYRSERKVGSGLGLAIVEELLVAMGGSAKVSSLAGGGTQFTLQLPTSQPA